MKAFILRVVKKYNPWPTHTLSKALFGEHSGTNRVSKLVSGGHPTCTGDLGPHSRNIFRRSLEDFLS